MAYADANQGVREEGILEFHSQQDLNKAMDELNGSEHKARKLRPLYVGSRCLLQNQSSIHPGKWVKSGVVMEVLPHDQFVVRIDGSHRLTRKNRRFLRLYNLISTSIDTRAFCGWCRDQPSSREDNVSHQSLDSPSIFSDGSNDARTNETNEADGDHKNVEEEQYCSFLWFP